MRRPRTVVLLVLLATLAFAAAARPNLKKTYFRLGNPSDAVTTTRPGTVLMGGSTDVDAAFAWLCERAGQGDFLVVRATGTDAYNPYVQQLCPGIHSVATLIVDSDEFADSAFVREVVDAAEVVWIAGGDQSDYIVEWTGTGLQAGIAAHVADGGPVGGTSAGLAVLTQFVYSALASQGVTSSQALADPYNKYVTLARDFLAVPGLEDTIGDTHFVPRDRMGRTLAFMCRIHANGWSVAPRAIAVDEETALLINERGVATVVGSNAAYFLSAPGAPEACAPATPLTYRNVAVRRVGPGGTFDVGDWRGSSGTTYAVTAEAGVLTSTQPGGSAY